MKNSLSQDLITSDMVAGALPNRLSEVPIWIILSRRKLYVRISPTDATVSEDPSFMTQARRLAADRQIYLFERWTPQDYVTLARVANDPSEDELRDISFIDGYYARHKSALALDSYTPPPTWWGQRPTEIVLRASLCDPRSNIYADNRDAAWAIKVSQNPFFCAPPEIIQWPMTMVGNAAFRGFISGDYFDIDTNKPWEEEKPVMLRAVAVMQALKDYPFPPPINIRPQYWYQSIKDDMNKFIRQDIIITPDLARMWITMAVIDRYNAVSAWILHDLEKDARDDRRNHIIQSIALGATLTLITVGLGLALAPAIAPIAAAGVPITAETVASGIMTGVQQALSAEQKEKLAEDMDKVGKMFEADAPAFAAEAYKVRDTFNYLGQAMEELTEEERAAIEQVRATPEYGAGELGEQYDVEPSNWPIQRKLLLAGGAAAGTAALVGLLFALDVF